MTRLLPRAPARTRHVRLVATVAVLCTLAGCAAVDGGSEPADMQRIPTQFIAALGNPEASSGSGVQSWGLWTLDPGPRGVRIWKAEELVETGRAPAGWSFDPDEWWLDENAIIMEKPDAPVAPGRYVVTGDRETVATLTVHPPDETGDVRWELDSGATLHDVTHLPCRSARYTPKGPDATCSPVDAPRSEFIVPPGSAMPDVPGCERLDHSVLFVIGLRGDETS